MKAHQATGRALAAGAELARGETVVCSSILSMDNGFHRSYGFYHFAGICTSPSFPTAADHFGEGPVCLGVLRCLSRLSQIANSIKTEHRGTPGAPRPQVMSDSEDSLGALLEAEFAALTDEENIVEEASPRHERGSCVSPACHPPPPPAAATRRRQRSKPTAASACLPLQWRAGSQEG